MTVRTFGLGVLLIGLAALPLALPAFAQNVAPIEARQDDMKAIGRSAKAAGQMLKGETAFDAAKSAEIFATMKASADRFGGLFPEDSKTGGDTEASPAIWEKPEDFKAKLAKFQGDIDAAVAANPQSLDAFKASFGAVGQNCKGCHQEFRVDK